MQFGNGPDDLEMFASEDDLARHGATRVPPRRSRNLSIAILVALVGAAAAAFTVGAYLYDSDRLWPSTGARATAPQPETQQVDREGVRPNEETTTPDGAEGGAVTGDGEQTAATNGDEVTSTDVEVPAPSAEPPSAPAPAAPTREASAPPAPARSPAPALPEAGSARDVSGAWTLATYVESSSLDAFEGLRLGYELRLQQDGNRVTGTGFKVTENGATIRPGGRTPITVEGNSQRDRLTLSFVERGARRPSSGRFVLFQEGENVLRGRFTSDAARSTGTVEARRR